MDLWNKKWLLAAAGSLILAALLFNDSFRATLSRRSAVARTVQELELLNRDIETVRAKIDRLRADPAAYEDLVRRDLGYLRPGEKEVRFLAQSR